MTELDITPANYKCEQKECPFNSGGDCLEQVDSLDDCQHLFEIFEDDDSDVDVSESVEDTEIVLSESQPSEKANSDVSVYRSEPLTDKDVDKLATEMESTVIIIAGDVNSGKTTLMGRSYSAFFKGPVGNWRFAGSKTLLGFDKRIHDHRKNSRRARASTSHTPRDVAEYYHLDVQSLDSNHVSRLIIYDISGENYQDAINTSKGAAALEILERADFIVIMLNGEHLLKKSFRAESTNRMIDILSAVGRVGLLKKSPRIQIVISKWDYINAAEKTQEISAVMDSIRNQLIDSLKDLTVESYVTIHGIASITHYPEIPAGYGFTEVFDAWASLRPKPLLSVTEKLPDIGPQNGWTALSRKPSQLEKTDV